MGATVKKQLLASTVLTVAVTMSSASSAKTKHPSPPPPPAPVYSWTGFYLGGNAGGAWGQSRVTSVANCNTPAGTGYICDSAGTGAANAAAFNAAGSGTINSSAFTGGIQAGYNYQWRGDGVVGVETDFDSFHLGGTRQGTGVYPVSGPGAPAAPPAGTAFAIANSTNTNWLWTFRGRIGWLAQPNLLAYVTGGAAVTRLSTSMNYSDTSGAVANGSASATKTGWTVGGGVEWLLTNNWSVKGEFLYLNFGSVTANASVPSAAKATAIGTISTKADLTAEIARLGLNYKF